MPLSSDTRAYNDKSKTAKARIEIVSRLLMLSVLANDDEERLIQALAYIFGNNTLRLRGDRLLVIVDKAQILMDGWTKLEAEQMLSEWIIERLELPYIISLELTQEQASASGAP